MSVPSPQRPGRSTRTRRGPTRRVRPCAAAPRDTAAAAEDGAWLLGLARTLQTSLDPDELLELFSARVQARVPHAAFEFLPPGEDRAAAAQRHAPGSSCTYELLLEEEALGSLRFTRGSAFTEAELAMLETLLSNLVHPLRNALNYRQAVRAAARDPLTGLNNRVSLDTVLTREVELSHRHGIPLSLIMLDVDDFKALNDTHGHLAGDGALRSLGGELRRAVRESDLLFRYGGEEFLVLLGSTSIAGAAALAERIRARVESLRVHHRRRRLSLTVSLGAAEYRSGDTAPALLARADAALYRAKSGGRNRVVVDRPPPARRRGEQRVL